MNTWRQTSPTGRALLVTVLLTGLTTFMFLPLLAVHLSSEGVPGGRVGFLVGLLAFCSQGFSLLCGLVVDRFGTRAVLASGFGLRIAGYALLSAGTASATAVAGIAAIGIGGSLLGLAVKTRLVAEDGVPARDMLALRSTFVNIGVIAGPALGALVYPLGFGWILAACVLSHLLLGVRLTLRPAAEAAAPAPRPDGGPAAAGSPAAAAAAAAADPAARRRAVRQWVPLCLVGVAFWALYSQLNVILPISAKEMTGSTAAISVVFTVNGLLVVLLQYTLLRHVFRQATARTLLVVGFLAFAAAYALLIPLAGWSALLAFVLPVTLAEMLIAPSLDEQAVQAGPLGRTGLALGAMSAAGAVGSLLGSSLGGFLLQTLHTGTGIWLVIVAVSVAAAASSLLLPKARMQHA
ncbi:Multidrug resistance protein MdtH (plasmid) [Streptomyces sp. enrichment culture]|uniref:MFS transporter n=1 Tax=Streptomyces sp. enrichment culture TaxID=1795815 RepID=UPI003F544246